MLDAGLSDGDLIVIDRSEEPKNGSVAVCLLDGEFTVKRLKLKNKEIYLMPENSRYSPIKIDEGNELSIWGIVTYVVKKNDMRDKILIFLLFASFFEINAQYDDYDEDEYEETYLEPIKDKSDEGQKIFVEELLDLAGYILDEIEIYQRLPNHAKVFRVKYDEKSKGGFIFIRWDKKNEENYVANKLIDPGLYYNLKAAKEIINLQ